MDRFADRVMAGQRGRPTNMTPQLQPSIRLRVPLVAGEEETESLEGELRYDASDPYAVALEVHATNGTVSWTFARDLLADGRYEPSGEGDVLVWPCLSIAAESVTVIEFHTPQGDAMLQAPTRIVDRFLGDTFALVPQGAEAAHLPLDGLLAKLLARSSGR